MLEEHIYISEKQVSKLEEQSKRLRNQTNRSGYQTRKVQKIRCMHPDESDLQPPNYSPFPTHKIDNGFQRHSNKVTKAMLLQLNIYGFSYWKWLFWGALFIYFLLSGWLSEPSITVREWRICVHVRARLALRRYFAFTSCSLTIVKITIWYFLHGKDNKVINRVWEVVVSFFN